MELNLNLIFLAILAIFSVGAAILATSALINVIRLRNVRLSWRAGKLWGFPLFSTLFLFTALIAGSIALHHGAVEEIVAAGLYSWLGLGWFTASYYATKRFITDYGIVKNVNEPSQTVAWHQIRDFVEKEDKHHTHYIFIYSRDKSETPRELIRLELDVPNKEREYFQKLISHKLGNRIRCYMKDNINVEQFNNS